MLLEGLVIPVSFDTGLLLKGLDLIQDVITGAIDRTREWAEGLDHLGDVTGMSGDKLAAWSFVAEKAGVSVDTLANATVILEKGLVKADGTLDTTGKQLADFGINVFDVNGQVKDQSKLMSDIAKKYAELGTQTERVNFLTGIFGRSGANLNDVFDTLANEGGIDAVTQKVNNLGLNLDSKAYEDFARGLNEIQLVLTGLAAQFVGPLLPGAEKILGIFQRWLETPWISDEIKQIGGALGTLLDDLAIGLATGNWDKLWGDLTKFLPKLDPVALTEAFKNWVASVDWGQISTDFAEGIKKVDWAGGTRSAILSITNIAQALIDAINRTNWGDLGDALRVMITGILRDGIGAALVSAWLGAVQGFWAWVDSQLGTDFGSISINATINNPAANHAAGGAGNGLSWVGERGPELVNLPRGSYVNNAQSSAGMSGIDYDRLARVLALELAKVTN